MGDFFVRVSIPSDAEALLDLNRRWQREQLQTIENGFLSATFSLEVCRQVIGRRESVTALHGERIIGYYLLNPASKFEPLHRCVTTKRIARGELPQDIRVGYSTQGVIEKEFQGSGLLPRMVEIFHDLLRNKYDMTVSTISIENPRSLRAHLKLGFEVVDVVEKHFVVSKKLRELDNVFISDPVMPLPPPTEAGALE
jgi:hypothetical protein